MNEPKAAMVCVIDTESMTIEDLLSFIMISSMGLSKSAPEPFDQAIDSITTACATMITKLDSDGVVSEAEIKKKAFKLMKETAEGAQKAAEEIGLDDMVEKAKKEIEKRSEEAERN